MRELLLWFDADSKANVQFLCGFCRALIRQAERENQRLPSARTVTSLCALLEMAAVPQAVKILRRLKVK